MRDDADPALYAAQRLVERYNLTALPITSRQLAEICRQERVLIRVLPVFEKWGVYVSGPKPMIVIRKGASCRVVAHELYHHFAREQEPELDASLTPRRRALLEERACHRFAGFLCSKDARIARLLGIQTETIPKPAPSATLPAPSASLIYAWAPRAPAQGGQASISGQVRECRVRADAEELQPAGIFTDYAMPLPAHERIEGSRLFREAAQWRAEGVGAVYVAHLTRLGPSRGLRQPLIAAVEAAGMELRSLELSYWGTYYL